MRNLFAVIKSWFSSSMKEIPVAATSEAQYYSLAPVDNAENAEPYLKALSWAISNRKEKNIKNVALTGPYGSGKSSILRTFQNKNEDKSIHFLNISLATFKEQEESSKPDTSSDELLRLIELSILQQIFYFEDDSKIPDSRFRRIKSQKKSNLIWTSICISVFIIVTFFLFNRTFLKEKFINVEVSDAWYNVFHYCAISFFLLGTFIIIYKSTRIINSLRIDKLNFQNAEIKVDENVSKSILNHHLDEILYFFEVTPYNVVIIEDLDRFKQTEIFTKLRELNLLINNSKKTKKDVVFIYAVRDDLFIDKDRTKFFDFIIPIIPVINSSNSNEKFSEKIKYNSYKIDEVLLEDISLFVDDMRLLNNIINEFNIYQKKLNQNLDKNKLFAMIVYKNIYPNDFVNLSNGQGSLYNVFAEKNDYIHKEILIREKKKNNNRERIAHLESLHIKSIKELRYLYLVKYVERINNFISFKINDNQKNISEATENEAFEYFKNDTAKAISLSPHQTNPDAYYRLKEVNIVKFANIEAELGSYGKRERDITDFKNGEVEALKRGIEESDNEIRSIRAYKIQELLSNNSFTFNLSGERQKQLINILLSSGYIDEDYFDYISIFYEGSLTKDDHHFLLNVKSRNKSVLNYPLNKISNLIKKIYKTDFSQNYILNINLVDFLLTDKSYQDERNLIFKQLSDESETSIRFIDEFVLGGVNVEFFIKTLCENWSGIWRFINNNSNFTSEKKERYLSLIIESSEIDDIKQIASKSNLKNTISKNKNFLSLIREKEKIKEVIQALDVKFEELIVDNDDEDLLDFVYKGNYYEINLKMISLIIKEKGNFNQVDVDTKNYFSIKQSGCKELISYINWNLDTYIEDVYLKLENNNSEDEQCLIELLNNSLNVETKKEIIRKVDTKINKLSTIKDKEIKEILLTEFKVEVDWDNVIDYFVADESMLNETIVSFLNEENNAAILAQMEIPKNIPSEEICDDFIEKLMVEESIENSKYELILSSIPYNYNEDFGYSELSYEKVNLLIDAQKLVVNPSNFESLKGAFDKLHIKLIEGDNSEFLSNFIDYKFDEDDIIELLKSNKIPLDIKSNIVSSAEKEVLISNSKITYLIGKHLLQESNFTKDKELVKEILLLSKLTDTERISLLIVKEKLLSNNEITEILSKLSYPYSDISIKGKRPVIDISDQNFRLAITLQLKGYISKYETEKKGIRISTFKK